MIDFDSIFSRSRFWTASSLLDFTPLSKAQKEHLAKVYATLAMLSVITICGASVPQEYFSTHPMLLLFAFLGSMLYVVFSGSRYRGFSSSVSKKRLLAAAAMAFSQGLLLRELLLFMYYFNPEIITTALFATVAVFTCFSLASMFMSSRMLLYVSALTVSLSIYISMVRFANFFVGSRFVNDLTDVGVLLSFCGFVIFDTQITLKEFSYGSRDFLMHAIMLYGDIVNIFLKTMSILYEKEKKKEKDRNSHREY
ncbi:hypothetical protein BgAZ_500370 [Babesia gibsoni]|uniref:Bax inhibitor 1 n=1 Tax=Babesia gibsoni TaxID=33632 RepID=A0AAD8P7K8_BABGI|nr:hypothetical protein BgAZ_500370 [Babesia gibsoni]